MDTENRKWYKGLTWLCCDDTLAKDDFLWSVRCPVETLYYFFRSPQKWVDGLNHLDGSPCQNHLNGPKLRLLDHFTVQMFGPATLPGTVTGTVQIDGVSDTGIIRLVATVESIEGILEDWADPLCKSRESPVRIEIGEGESRGEAYWKAMYAQLKDVAEPCAFYDDQNQRWFSHIQIYNKRWGGQVDDCHHHRAKMTAQYLLMRLLYGTDYANSFLAAFEWLLSSPGKSTPNKSKHVKVLTASTATFTYAADGNSNDEICDIQFGDSDGSSLNLENAVVKDYTNSTDG